MAAPSVVPSPTFKAFAAYQLALNKIDTQSGYPTTIDWPIAPAN
jgi:hypothetical protein